MSRKYNYELERVSINLPKKLVQRIKEYSKYHGLNVTSAYIILLTEKLDTTNF